MGSYQGHLRYHFHLGARMMAVLSKLCLSRHVRWGLEAGNNIAVHSLMATKANGFATGLTEMAKTSIADISTCMKQGQLTPRRPYEEG